MPTPAPLVPGSPVIQPAAATPVATPAVAPVPSNSTVPGSTPLPGSQPVGTSADPAVQQAKAFLAQSGYTPPQAGASPATSDWYSTLKTSAPDTVNTTDTTDHQNIIQKGLNVLLSDPAKLADQGGQEIGKFLLKSINAVTGGALNKYTPEGNLDAAITRAGSTGTTIPILGTDVKALNDTTAKDVLGESLGTAGLLVGSPLAAGALLGTGSSLEQGNDLFSLQTALQATLGAGGGKLLDLIGKPLFNVAGKVIGQITPQYLSDLAAKGANALTDFADKHGVSMPFSGLAEKVGTAADAVSEKVGQAKTAVADNIKAEFQKAIGARSDAQKAISQSIQDTMPLQDKATRIAAGENTLPGGQGAGGITRTGVLGNQEITPDAHNIEVGLAAHPYISGTTDPVEKLGNLNQAIKDNSQSINDFLDKNPTDANFADMRQYISDNLTPNSTIKSDPGAYESYSRAAENAINTLNDTLKKSAAATGDYGSKLSGTPIRQARINIDKQIQEELGTKVFGTPQYTGIKAASVDARNVLNRMNEDMLRYPGQLSDLNKYNQALADFRERGIDVDEPTKQGLKDKYILTSTPDSEANANALSAAHRNLSNIYEARDNINIKNQTNVGKSNYVSEHLENHPVQKAVVKAIPVVSKIAAGADIAAHV